jgi:hypothetical protein
MSNKISDHISYDEATLSPTAMRLKIDNTPNEAQYTAMIMVANQCFEPLRKWYGKPIKINSFFRCDKLNKAVKGAKNSQHVSGHAIDLTAGSREENKKLFDWAKDNLEYDQLINEYDFSWVHISYVPNNNRKQTLAIV